VSKVTLPISLILAVALGATSVFAGPMAMDKTVAPVPPPCDWTGFYVGVNGGVGWQQSRFTDQNSAVYEGYYLGTATNTFDNVDYLAGGQAGYNYQ
jgi:outer membrane immunogenic protein